MGLQIDTDSGILRLSGALTLAGIGAAERELRAALSGANGDVTLDLSGLEALDSAGALLLVSLWQEAEGRKIAYAGVRPEQRALFELVRQADLSAPPAPPSISLIRGLLIRIGKGAVQAWEAGLEILGFLGQSAVGLVRALRRPKHFRLSSITRHIDETGIDAIPIVCLIAFLISIVLAYQGAQQLRPLGAEQFTVNLMGISVLREMGVLLTAIMVAGRSGSAFTAEIGVMKVREEVDALQVTGIDPFEVLVMPRLIALVITLPLLTFIADMMGLFGGAMICTWQLGIPIEQFLTRLRASTHGNDLFVGLIKAPVFAILIAVVGCMHGMKVSGSAESVGSRTTASVVHSIFLVLVADAFFSILFAKLHI